MHSIIYASVFWLFVEFEFVCECNRICRLCDISFEKKIQIQIIEAQRISLHCIKPFPQQQTISSSAYFLCLSCSRRPKTRNNLPAAGATAAAAAAAGALSAGAGTAKTTNALHVQISNRQTGIDCMLYGNSARLRRIRNCLVAMMIMNSSISHSKHARYDRVFVCVFISYAARNLDRRACTRL